MIVTDAFLAQSSMAENAMKDVCQLTNPRKATKEQIIGIFKAAY